MTGYVSKDDLEEFFKGITITNTGRTRGEAIRAVYISEVLKAIYNGVMKLPTTDAAPVIRCKDCKHRFEGEMFPNCCEIFDELMTIRNKIDDVPAVEAIPIEWLKRNALACYGSGDNPFQSVIVAWELENHETD